jgi:hypothetical protein
MAVFILDTSIDPTDTDYAQTHELDGREYVLRFTWCSRDASWGVSVYLTDGTPLSLGRKIVLGIPLLNGEIDSRLPAGALMAIDPTGSDVDPGLGELGGRVLLAYYDAAEFAS